MFEDQAFLGGGDLSIQRQDPVTGSWGPLHGPFDCEEFSYQPQSEKMEKTSKGKNTYGQVRATVFKPTAPLFSVTLGQVNRENLTLALMGTAVEINRAGGTLTAEEVTVSDVASWIELPWANIKADGLIVTNEAGDVTYTRDTHYIVNLEMGWLMILAGSGIAKDAVLKITGTYGAITGTRIDASTINQIRARFILDWRNLAGVMLGKATAKQVAMSSTEAFDMLSDEFVTVKLNGSCETPVGHTTGFELEIRKLA